MYEFQFGEGPMDPKAPRYVLPGAFETDTGEEKPPAGRVDRTRIDSLGLEVGRSFGYWFDFGDDWWHQINVEAIEDKVPAGKKASDVPRAKPPLPRTHSLNPSRRPEVRQKVGRNDPCPCGSGKKFKKCCGLNYP